VTWLRSWVATSALLVVGLLTWTRDDFDEGRRLGSIVIAVFGGAIVAFGAYLYRTWSQVAGVKPKVDGSSSGVVAANVPALEGARVHLDRSRLPSGPPTTKILFLAANPISSDYSRLALDEEARDIQQKLDAAKYRQHFDLVTRWAVRPDDLQDALLREQPTVVHFSGHGDGEPGIVLHSDGAGKPNRIDADALKSLFTALRDNIRIVVLNACYSEVQARAINEVIDFVIGMSDEIGDEAARHFAASFYRALAFNRNVQNAFDLGVAAIKGHGRAHDALLPVLLTRPGSSAHTTVLVEEGAATP
jgi:CHAT domain